MNFFLHESNPPLEPHCYAGLTHADVEGERAIHVYGIVVAVTTGVISSLVILALWQLARLI